MEIADSARKHGVYDEDIRHAVRHAVRAVRHGAQVLYIGPDRNARLLEVVVLDEDDVAIHAMQLRPKFYDYL